MTRRLLPASLVFSLLLLCVPGSAAAAPWTCEASTVRGTLGPAPAIEFRTKVRFRVGNPRLFRTFTLPQRVDVG